MATARRRSFAGRAPDSLRNAAGGVALIVFVTLLGSGTALADDGIRCANPAQTCDEWLAIHTGNNVGSADQAYAVRASHDGTRVFVTGHVANTVTGEDLGTAAYDADSGARLWTNDYKTTGLDWGRALAVGPDDTQVYATGYSMQPDSSSVADIVTIAYDATTGERTWVARWDTPEHGSDLGYSVGVSPDGTRVYVAGYAADDAVLLAYDSASGEEIWSHRYDGDAGGRDFFWELAIGPRGDVVFGVGTTQKLLSGGDYLVAAFDAASGDRRWLTSYNGPGNGGDEARAAGLSSDGSLLYVTGESAGVGTQLDFGTAAFDTATGERMWAASYDLSGGYDIAYDLAVDPTGRRVFVTGQVQSLLTCTDMGTVAYDARSGAELWADDFDGAGGAAPGTCGGLNDWDAGFAAVAAPGGNRVYVTGWVDGSGFEETHDFDYQTLAFDASSGLRVWTQVRNEFDYPSQTEPEFALGIDAAPNGSSVYVTGGLFTSLATGGDYGTLSYFISEAPSAILTGDVVSGEPPLRVTFTLQGSDSDGSLESWRLDADGDGTADYGGEGAPPSTLTHTYQARGTYTARLTVSDDHGAVGRDEVVVTVQNRPPDAVDDSATAVNGIRVTINVLANDSDPDGDSLTVTGVSNPAHGTAVINPNQTVTYDPDCAFQGTETFTYTIDDGYGGTDTATVSVRVRKTSRRGSIPC